MLCSRGRWFPATRLRLGSDALPEPRIHHARVAAWPRRILVGFDGSDVAWRALDSALELVGYGSALTVVALSPEPRALPSTLLEDVRERVHRRGHTAAYLRRLGDPLEGLLAAAREVDAELIVVGRDEAPVQEVPRSVGEALVRLASCDVLVVR